METTSTAGLLQFGEDCDARGEHLRALGFFAEALRLGPSDHGARRRLGRVLATIGESELAVRALVVAGQRLGQRGFGLLGIATLLDAHRIAPSDPRVSQALGRLHDCFTEGQGEVGGGALPSLPMPIPKDLRHSLIRVGDPAELIGKVAELLSRDLPEEPGAERVPVPFFSSLSRTSFLALTPNLSAHHAAVGHALLRPVDAKAAILIGGEAMAFAGEPPTTTPLGRFGAGSVFGLASLKTGGPGDRTVIASKACEFFELGRVDLERASQRAPEIFAELDRLLAAKEQAALLS
jgi:hypothetical protein